MGRVLNSVHVRLEVVIAVEGFPAPETRIKHYYYVKINKRTGCRCDNPARDDALGRGSGEP